MKSDDGVTAVVGAADSHMGAYSNPNASGIRLRHRSNLQSNDWSFQKLTEIESLHNCTLRLQEMEEDN